MKFCQPHWDQLRADVENYGLSHLIAPDGEAATTMIKRQLDGADGPLDFDPLMNAHNALMSMALRLLGLAIMEGEKCPACELQQYNWVEGAAYQSRIYAEKNGLLLDVPEAK